MSCEEEEEEGEEEPDVMVERSKVGDRAQASFRPPRQIAEKRELAGYQEGTQRVGELWQVQQYQLGAVWTGPLQMLQLWRFRGHQP